MVVFDYDKRKRQAIIKTEDLGIIREHFSFENEGARFARRYGRYMPARTYIITPAGKYEVGLTVNIIQFVKIIQKYLTEYLQSVWKCIKRQ